MSTVTSRAVPTVEPSARELEVVQLIADGLTSEEIAKQLWISPETVKAHVKSVLRKTSAENRTHAVAILMRRGTIS